MRLKNAKVYIYTHTKEKQQQQIGRPRPTLLHQEKTDILNRQNYDKSKFTFSFEKKSIQNIVDKSKTTLHLTERKAHFFRRP